MGKAKKHVPAKLIIGLIFKEQSILKKSKVVLKKAFGKIDFESPAFPFTYTRYYEAEMGGGLSRVFFSFSKLINPATLAKVKLFTNKLEDRFSQRGKRRVNIDPGYLDMAKLVLATTKDYMHRIYLGKGIFAEVTLRFDDKSFKPWEWTYPDYKTKEYIDIFNCIRSIYAQQK